MRLERVKCRTGGRSPSRTAERSAWGPGEDRHLMRVWRHMLQAGGWGCFSPSRLPRGERGVWGKAPRFPNPPHANSGDSFSEGFVFS